jgi:hypothetical protein
MKSVSIFIIFLYSTLLIYVHSSTQISFSTSGTGYTVSDNIVTIAGDDSYDLSGDLSDKKIIVSSSCTLNFNSFSLKNNGSLTPLIISENQAVKIVLTDESTLQDSSTNENNGTIYLQKGASLTISGTGTLNIIPNKYMAINGTEETSLTVNDGATIDISSESSDVGGIYLRKAITFNNAILLLNCPSGSHHDLDNEGSITIVEGRYTIYSGNGKGIQAETNLYIGVENGSNSDLNLYIYTSNEGIEAKQIYIYFGTITITAEEDGINAAASGDECDETINCSGNCACSLTFAGGDLTLITGEDGLDINGDLTIIGGNIKVFAASNSSDHIDQDGALTITGGNIIAAGSPQMGGVRVSTTTQVSKTYTGTIAKDANLIVYDESNNELLSVTTPKEANYVFFNFPKEFSVKLNDEELTISEYNSNNNNNPGGNNPGGNNPPNNPNNNSNNNSSDDDDDSSSESDDDSNSNINYLKLSNFAFLFIFILI